MLALQPVKREDFRENFYYVKSKRRHGMRAMFLNNEFLSFICKFIRNFHNKPDTVKIPSIFQETIENNKAN